MMAELFKQIKNLNPSTAIVVIALAGFLFLSTTVVSKQDDIADKQSAVIATLDEHSRKTDALVVVLQEILKEMRYANVVQIRYLEENCYVNAKTDAQRQRCRDLR